MAALESRRTAHRVSGGNPQLLGFQGSVVGRTGRTDDARQLVATLERLGKPARFSSLALSPDGTCALVSIQAPQGTANQDLWLFDFTRAPLPRRVSFGPALEYSPVWQTNDRFVFGSGGGASGVYWQAVDGERELLFRTGRAENPTSIESRWAPPPVLHPQRKGHGRRRLGARR